MADNYPVLCTVRYKDRRMTLTYRIRVKPVTLNFAHCLSSTCLSGRGVQDVVVPKNSKRPTCPCGGPSSVPVPRKLFKLYTTADIFVRGEWLLQNAILWRVRANFRRGVGRWGSREVLCFKLSHDALEKWFRYNRGDVSMIPARPAAAFAKKISIEWYKGDLPTEAELDAIVERRALLHNL